MEQIQTDSRAKLRLDVGFLIGASGLLSAVITLSALSRNAGEMLTRNTVRLSLAWYVVALCLMMRLRTNDWRATSNAGRIARWSWTWAVLCYLVHVGMAFHFYHHWSHANAFEHTRQESGVGEGVYVNYFFTGLWIADALWWWIRPDSYATRSIWVDRALHGFMLFIVFNAVVVFESGPIRAAGIVVFVGLSIVWLMNRGLPRLRFT